MVRAKPLGRVTLRAQRQRIGCEISWNIGRFRYVSFVIQTEVGT